MPAAGVTATAAVAASMPRRLIRRETTGFSNMEVLRVGNHPITEEGASSMKTQPRWGWPRSRSVEVFDRRGGKRRMIELLMHVDGRDRRRRGDRRRDRNSRFGPEA